MKDLSIVLAGEAGQGVNSIEVILIGIIKKAGYNVYATKEYMSRVRGGINTTQLRVSTEKVAAYVNRTDILVPFVKGSAKHMGSRIQDATIIIGDKDKFDNDKVINVPFQRIASEHGDALYANSVAVGTICGILGIEKEIISGYISEKFSKKDKLVIKNNVESASSGYEIARELINEDLVKIDIGKPEGSNDDIMVTGADAVAIGALAGGCDSIFAYPMTPGTGVFTALAGYSHKAGVIVEQAEDEIAAINMAIGAWYAGSRSMVTTSGGGFALMTEGMSLAGITESPVVVHLAQRPGPGTGLPTRTEQGDLNLALYSGHGVFAKAIYAPGTTQQAFELGKLSFETADKYQVPSIILTDQYFVDTYYNTPEFKVEDVKIQKHIVKTDKNYKRYALTDDGLSPRGVPGNGDGVVCLDSDEHDESGRITEDLDGISLEMKNKRTKKFGLLENDVVEPELIGNKDYKNLIICWGSTYQSVKEALEVMGRDDTAMLHYSQVFPLHKKTAEYIKKAEKVIVLENNQLGQFADLITQSTAIELKNRILKYNGMMFTVEEVVEEILKAIK